MYDQAADVAGALLFVGPHRAQDPAFVNELEHDLPFQVGLHLGQRLSQGRDVVCAREFRLALVGQFLQDQNLKSVKKFDFISFNALSYR